MKQEKEYNSLVTLRRKSFIVTIKLEKVVKGEPSNALLVKVHGRRARHGSRSPRIRIVVWRRQVFERVR